VLVQVLTRRRSSLEWLIADRRLGGKRKVFRPASCRWRGCRFVLREGSAASKQAVCQTGRTLDAGFSGVSVLGRGVPIPLACAPGGSAPPLTFRRGLVR
jgi:hypothetical protein